MPLATAEQSRASTVVSPSRARIFGYSLGEGAASISLNGISAFAMLYYSQVLGVPASLVGIALGITVFWDAISDPVMGYVSDCTRSRFGSRLPYVVAGGFLLAVSFFLLWVVPAWFETTTGMFIAVLGLNLAVRTASTILLVPYTALGFEMCQTYLDRSTVQGVRYFVNMITNLVFVAIAWMVFFPDSIGEDGQRIDGTLVKSNYLLMSSVLSVALLLFVLGSVWATRIYAIDNRGAPTEGKQLSNFFKLMSMILRDRIAWIVFGFYGFAQFGMMVTSQLQMYTYVFFMEFRPIEKTFVHGAGMVAFALGSLVLPFFVDRIDKKRTAYVGVCAGMIGNLGLAALFSTGILPPRTLIDVFGLEVPIGVVLFGLGQALWWGGCGMLTPLATSMIADISNLDQRRSGMNRDGSYSALFSFSLKAAASVGLLVTGIVVPLSGIVPEATTQTPEASSLMALLTFLIGPVTLVAAFLVVRTYPLDRKSVE